MNILNLTSAQLRRAADIKDTISLLQKTLDAVFKGMPEPIENTTPTSKPIPGLAEIARIVHHPHKLKRRAMSPEAKHKISLAAKRRWRKARNAGRNHI